MDIRIRFLAANIAVLTAVAGLFNPLSPEWTEVYEKRLFLEMEMNMERGKHEQTTGKEVLSGTDTISAGTEAVEERTVVWAEERMAVNESQAGEAEMEGVVFIPEATETSPEGTQGEAAPSPESQAEDTVVKQTPANVVDNPVPVPGAPLYQIDGDTLDPGVANYLYRRLCEAGIGFFYEFSVCLAYQESSFNPLAENPNGRDKGLFQFRVEFHPGLDWRNPYQQVDLFVQMMANRAAAGCDPYMMISRHNTSDYCPDFNAEYVAQVLQHLPKLRKG